MKQQEQMKEPGQEQEREQILGRGRGMVWRLALLCSDSAAAAAIASSEDEWEQRREEQPYQREDKP